jgi:hypothetical protein
LSVFDSLHLYAYALHDVASKYGERQWENCMPEENLVNHALRHLFKLLGDDSSEYHLSHLVWNIMTIIHFRKQEERKPNEFYCIGDD